MKNVTEYFTNEQDFPDLDAAGALTRLSRAIQCRTVNHADHALTDFREFDRLHALMREGYPRIAAAGRFELIGRAAVLITLPGSDETLRPCLFMSHQDVVPVAAGTEGNWAHPPFSGAVAEGWLWGRGALDIKNQVFGALEAAEYLLAHGASFRRTVYLAFGDDEETLNLGAKAIADTLEARGVRLEFLLDEGGGTLTDGAPYGAPGVPVLLAALQEKGYADLELTVRDAGGHSSRPFGGTSLGRLSRAIARIVDDPFPPRLTPVMAGAFTSLAPYMTQEPLRGLVRRLPDGADAVARYCMGQRELFPFVTTTLAPTMIRGGSDACNVMPQDMRAVVNIRIAEGDSVEGVLAHIRAAVDDPAVELRFLQANAPSAAARTDGLGYALLRETMRRYFAPAVLTPGLTAGATDARRYEGICDTCLRCSPFLADEEEARGVHGTNERISRRAYAQGIRALIRLMDAASR